MFDSFDTRSSNMASKIQKKYDCAIVFTRKCQKSFVRGIELQIFDYLCRNKLTTICENEF